MEEYNVQKILSKVKSAFAPGPFFKESIMQSQFVVTDAVEPTVKQKFESAPLEKSTPIDVWNQRRSK